MCFDFSTIMSETFLILTITEQDIVSVHRFSCKISVILAIFNET